MLIILSLSKYEYALHILNWSKHRVNNDIDYC